MFSESKGCSVDPPKIGKGIAPGNSNQTPSYKTAGTVKPFSQTAKPSTATVTENFGCGGEKETTLFPPGDLLRENKASGLSSFGSEGAILKGFVSATGLSSSGSEGAFHKGFESASKRPSQNNADSEAKKRKLQLGEVALQSTSKVSLSSDIRKPKFNHVCIVCSKSFPLRQTLLEHHITHVERKLFKCSCCSKEMKKESSLKSHMKTYHPNDQYIERRFTIDELEQIENEVNQKVIVDSAIAALRPQIQMDISKS